MSERLCVVVPVYNEMDIVGMVLAEWAEKLHSLGIDFTIRAYNDGSTDGTLNVLQASADILGSRLEIRDKVNSGHGDTILLGYREAASDGFDWVFQVDSDNEMKADAFDALWSMRQQYDFLIGKRAERSQAWARKIVSFFSRLSIQTLYGNGVWDVNSPYRLMRISAFGKLFNVIPPMTFAPNVILSGLAAYCKMRYFEVLVPCQERKTGENSLKKWKLFRSAIKSWWQTLFFRIALFSSDYRRRLDR